MTQAVRTVRSATVRAWVDGWAASRQAPRPVREPWGLRVDVGLPGHLTRHIVPAPTPATLRHLTSVLTEPGTWLKLCAPAQAVTRWLPPPWSVQEPEFMMTAPLEETPVTAPMRVPAGYTMAVTTRAGVTVARLLTDAGEVAARGQMAVSGASAVVDQVETARHHQRRGLGTLVMRALTSSALAGGADTGVLVATPAGRSLYETLGWSVHTPVTAAVIT